MPFIRLIIPPFFSAVPALHGIAMKISWRTVTVASAAVSAAAVQAASGTASLTPAATTVIASAPSGPPLFPIEAVQLTDGVLADVAAAIQNETVSSLFAFGTSASNGTVSKRGARSCKLLPGDLHWPIDLVWHIFDLLLGGRLIKTVPLAAACYPEWPEYDAANCAAITSKWLTSNLQ